MTDLKRTPLYDLHVSLGGKMVPFGGYELPVQYASGIKQEHMAVREAVGIFDVSHMAEFIISGPQALAAINHLLTNQFDSMKDGGCRYTLLCNPAGGIKDDLLVYRMSENRYLLVVNAANREKDREWIKANMIPDATFEDVSDEWAQLALQGPLAPQVLEKVAPKDQLPERYYTFTENVSVAGIPCLISRTGYTGEDGYELYMPADGAVAVCQALLEAGKEEGIMSCGLGARDTLRLEAAMPLYGHELNEDIDPISAGLTFAVKMNKEEFIGKAALEKLLEPTMKRVGLKMIGRGIAREGAVVQYQGQDIGVVTSGTQLPYVNAACAMARVGKDCAEIGTKLDVIIREKPVACEVVALPFYKREEGK